jgi:hypothetical protein
MASVFVCPAHSKTPINVMGIFNLPQPSSLRTPTAQPILLGEPHNSLNWLRPHLACNTISGQHLSSLLNVQAFFKVWLKCHLIHEGSLVTKAMHEWPLH